MHRAREGEGVLQQLALGVLAGLPRGQHVDAHLVGRDAAGLLHGLGDAAARGRAHHDAVDHDLDGVLVLLVELDALLELHDLAVHAHAGEALAQEVGEELGELALAAQDHGGEDVGAAAVGGRDHLVHYLVGGLAFDDAAALRAVGRAHAGEEEPEVVVDLGHRAHGGARVLGRGLLVDGDSRREAVDGVEVGLVHLAEEHAGVAGQALHVATLALGVHRVEGERALAGPRQARDDHELVAGDRDVYVFKVVLPSTADDDRVGCHWADLPYRTVVRWRVCA